MDGALSTTPCSGTGPLRRAQGKNAQRGCAVRVSQPVFPEEDALEPGGFSGSWFAPQSRELSRRSTHPYIERTMCYSDWLVASAALQLVLGNHTDISSLRENTPRLTHGSAACGNIPDEAAPSPRHCTGPVDPGRPVYIAEGKCRQRVHQPSILEVRASAI